MGATGDEGRGDLFEGPSLDTSDEQERWSVLNFWEAAYRVQNAFPGIF